MRGNPRGKSNRLAHEGLHPMRQLSPEANMQRTLPSAPYFSIGAPTMLPYSVQDPS